MTCAYKHCTPILVGLELEAQALPVEEVLLLTPKNKVSLNATYCWDMFELDWSVTGSYYYQGEQWMSPFNDPLYDKVGSWDRWGARMTAADKAQVWKITAFVNNITDDPEIVTLGRPSTVTQNAQTNLTDPRIYGLRLDYNF